MFVKLASYLHRSLIFKSNPFYELEMNVVRQSVTMPLFPNPLPLSAFSIFLSNSAMTVSKHRARVYEHLQLFLPNYSIFTVILVDKKGDFLKIFFQKVQQLVFGWG